MSEQISFDDLPVIWMEDGLPCFMGDRADICDLAESFGFNIYYLLANQAKEVKPTPPPPNTTYGKPAATALAAAPPTFVRNSQIYRVVNNFVGRTVTVCSPSFPQSFIDVEEEATYSMPAIPHILIDKLDQFFRLVDAQHGAESIVMLTYDTTKEGPEGWGILVPDQTNTSVHCNYDPDSIAQVKPDEVMIVGSVHSHPGMSAYASGTDHADQADFDGIHITFGWQKTVNNGATQYYAELQMAGKAYKLDIEDVFEEYIIEKAPDPEVVGWTEKVKKANPPKAGGSVTVTTGAAYQAPRPNTNQGTPASTVAGTLPKNQYYIDYPSHIKNITHDVIDIDNDNILVCEVVGNHENKTYNCPGCFSIIAKHDVYASNCCPFCDIPLSEQDTTADQIIWDMFQYCNDRKIPTNASLYLLTADLDNSPMLLRLTAETMDAYSDSAWIDIEDKVLDVDPKLTLCCSMIPENCMCPTQVVTYDSMDFDQFMGKSSVYVASSACEVCNYYYDTNCPSYSKAIVDFKSNTNQSDIKDKYEDSIDGVNCDFFSEYTYSTSEDIYNS